MIIQPITNTETYDAVIKLAAADGHVLLAPTHIIKQGDQIIGAITIAPSPIVWMSTTESKVRDSIHMEEQLSTFFAMSGAKLMCLPCTKNSPYHEYLTKAGYFNAGSYDLFFKPIT